jgi:hypothetical protein
VESGSAPLRVHPAPFPSPCGREKPSWRSSFSKTLVRCQTCRSDPASTETTERWSASTCLPRQLGRRDRVGGGRGGERSLDTNTY